ncbi:MULTISPECIES: hypothetical protein [unclassified Microcoleus]|uniref:hypothetical protein n=1 Tax=unclassified Microcoleus TaxID=2642155 RepID=UPI002FCED0DA
MQTYTAIALLSLLGVTLSASAALSIQSPVEQLETATAQYMLAAQTQQRRDRPPSPGNGRHDFREPGTHTGSLQQF